MRHFWAGFRKKASSDTGGSGHTGVGKGSMTGQLERDRHDGTEEGYGRADGDDSRTSKELLDRERGPRDFALGERGPEFQDQSNPHIKY